MNGVAATLTAIVTVLVSVPVPVLVVHLLNRRCVTSFRFLCTQSKAV